MRNGVTISYLLLSAVCLEILFVSLLLLKDPAQYVVETIALLLLAGAIYVAACRVVLNQPNTTKSFKMPALIAGAALVFRLTVSPLMPELSDDPFRYRWEGKVQAAGGNPYTARPAAPEWEHLRDSAYPRITGKDFKAVYGPLIQLIQHGTYRVVQRFIADPLRQVFWFKLPYAVADLAILALLFGWVGSRALIYAWSPLPILEFWASGHHDSLLVFLLAAALFAAERERWQLSSVALALAAAAKIWPLLLFPVWLARMPGRARWQCAALAVSIWALLAAPYWTDVSENVRFLSGFLSGWRNNDSLFAVISWAAGDVYTAKKITLAIIAALVAAVTLRPLPLRAAALWVICGMLFVSANCHPWYLTWFLPLLVFYPEPALLLWTVLVPLAYGTVIEWRLLGEWHGSTALRWYEYAPVFALLLVKAGRTLLRNRPRTAG